MKTTELFAELVVIGVGATSALLLVLFTILPNLGEAVDNASAIFVIPALALLYLSGIVTDRVADYLAEPVLEHLMKLKGIDYKEVKAARICLLGKSAVFRENWLYARSRSRIVRGWVINSLLLIPSSIAYALLQDCS